MATKKILGLDFGVNSMIEQVLKVVLLTVLIAMSPLNAPVNAGNNVVELRETKSNNIVEKKKLENDVYNFDISVEKDQKNSNSYKIKVYAESKKDYNLLGCFIYEGYVMNFNKVNYNVYDDTGKKVSQFKFNSVGLNDVTSEENIISVSDKDVCNYIQELIIKYDVGIAPYNRNFNLKMSSNGHLTHAKPSTNWLKETDSSNTLKYGKVLSSGDIETEDGPYRVYMHSIDGDDSNFEVVSVLNKDGSIRHKVTGVIACNAYISGWFCDDIADIALHQINLEDLQGKTQVICNKELWEILIQLSQVTDYNNAYDLKDIKRRLFGTDEVTGKLSESEPLPFP